MSEMKKVNGFGSSMFETTRKNMNFCGLKHKAQAS